MTTRLRAEGGGRASGGAAARRRALTAAASLSMSASCGAASGAPESRRAQQAVHVGRVLPPQRRRALVEPRATRETRLRPAGRGGRSSGAGARPPVNTGAQLSFGGDDEHISCVAPIPLFLVVRSLAENKLSQRYERNVWSVHTLYC